MLEKFTKQLFPKYLQGFKKADYSESLKILDATIKNYSNKYKSLLKINHPDKGGSAYICMKLNEAKNFLDEEGKELFELDKLFRK